MIIMKAPGCSEVPPDKFSKVSLISQCKLFLSCFIYRSFMLELKQQVLSGATSESTDTQTSVLFLLSALQGLFTLLVNFLSNFVNFASCRYNQQSKRFHEQKSTSVRASRFLVQLFFFKSLHENVKACNVSFPDFSFNRGRKPTISS